MLLNQAVLEALNTSLQAHFRNAFDGAPSQWAKVATLVPSGGKVNDYTWLGKFPRLREWIGDKAVDSLAAHRYTLENKDYEATIEVDRNDLEDDNLGIYAPMAQEMGYSARTFPDENVFALFAAGTSNLCYDGQYFFDTDHPVAGSGVSNNGAGSGTAWYLLCTSRPLKPLIYQQRKAPEFVRQDDPQSDNVFMRKKFLYGVEARGNFGYGFWQMAYRSAQTLDATYYPAARAAMMAYKDDQGRPLGLIPNLLVVPPSLEGAGRALLVNDRDDAGASNPWRGSADLLVVPWLA